MSRIIEGTIFEAVQGGMEDKIAEGSIEMTVIGMMVTIKVGIDQERGHSQELIAVTRVRNASNSRSRSGSQASTNRDRIRCYNWREYDHFARDCPTCQRRKGFRSVTTNAECGRRRRTNPFIE